MLLSEQQVGFKAISSFRNVNLNLSTVSNQLWVGLFYQHILKIMMNKPRAQQIKNTD